MAKKAIGRNDQIEAWMSTPWRPSKKGTGAEYLNHEGYHVAVWRDDNSGNWTWHIESNKPDDSYEEYGNNISSPERAKREVLTKLADKLGLA